MRARSTLNKDAFDLLYEEAARDSAEYIRKFINDSIITDGAWWDVASKKIEVDGLCLEFGVYDGTSINYFSNAQPNLTWYGFDSFEGFQEDWVGGYFGKDSFSMNGKIPKVNKNVKLIKGWFKDTLPNFLKGMSKNIAFINMDCDTYESTKQVLDMIGPERLVPNTRILFDEYHSYIGWKFGEYKAWQDFVKEHNIKYKYEMFGPRQSLIKICN